MKTWVLLVVLLISYDLYSIESYQTVQNEQIEQEVELSKKCRSNDMKACFKLAKIQKSLEKYDLSRQNFEKSCIAKIDESCGYYARYLLLDGQKDKGIKLLETRCNDGMASACFDRGIFDIVFHPKKKALNKWYKKGCAFGDQKSCYYNLFQQINRDGKKKVLKRKDHRKWYRKKCENKDHKYSCGTYVSVLMLYGETKKAENVATKGCEGGDAFACELIGFIKLGKKERKEGLGYFEKSCSLGFARGCWRLASFHRELGNNTLGKINAEKACLLDNTDACLALAGMNGVGSKKYKEYIKRSCYQSDPSSCRVYGVLEGEPVKSKMLKLSCSYNDEYACYLYGKDQLDEGKSDVALKYLQKSCEYSRGDACAEVGSIYFKQKNNEQSIEYFEKACEFGKAISCKNLCYLQSGLGRTKEAMAAYKRYCKMDDAIEKKGDLKKICEGRGGISDVSLKMMQKGSIFFGLGLPIKRTGNIENALGTGGFMATFGANLFLDGSKHGFNFGILTERKDGPIEKMYTASVNSPDDNFVDIGIYFGYSFQHLFSQKIGFIYGVAPIVNMLKFGDESLEEMNLSFFQYLNVNYLITKFWDRSHYTGIYASLGVFHKFAPWSRIGAADIDGHSIGIMAQIGVGL